ncbi:MAG: hypothetical protein WA160_06670 [Pseudobdellovibrio sp.]
MKSFPLSNLFTAVMFVLVSGGAWAGDRSDQSRIDAACGEGKSTSENCIRVQKEIDDKEKNADSKVACAAAKKEWRDKDSKGKRACNAFDKGLGATCRSKINGCQSKIDNTFGSSGSENESETGNLMLQLVKTALATKSNSIAADAVNDGPACVKQYDAKTKKEDEKEFNRERKELEKEIEKEKETQIKEVEDLNKKTDEVQKDIDKLEKENVKEAHSAEKTLSEKTSNASKNSLEVAKRIRKIQLEINSQSQKVARDKLANDTALFSLSSAETTKRCKANLLSLQGCILLPSSAEAADVKKCEALNAQLIKGKGTKSNSNVTEFMQQQKDACFKADDDKLRQAQLNISQTIATSNDNIAELKKQMDDELKNLDLAKKDVEVAKAQSESEKKSGDDAMLKEIDTMNNNLFKYNSTSNTKIVKSKARIDKLTLDLQNLALKKDYGVETAFDDANDAINQSESARSDAAEVCGCNSSGSTVSDVCADLMNSGIDQDPKDPKYKGSSKKTK